MIEEWEDEYGKWKRDEQGLLWHLERSQKWHDDHPDIPEEPPIESISNEEVLIKLREKDEQIDSLKEENASNTLSIIELWDVVLSK